MCGGRYGTQYAHGPLVPPDNIRTVRTVQDRNNYTIFKIIVNYQIIYPYCLGEKVGIHP